MAHRLPLPLPQTYQYSGRSASPDIPLQIQAWELLRRAEEAKQQAEQMCRQAAYKEQEARKLQERGDRLARQVVKQLEPTPPWFRRQEIIRREAAHRRALQEEAAVAAAVAAEEAKAREQTRQRQTRHRHNKQVRFLVPMGR